MARPIAVANWKMQLSPKAEIEFAQKLKDSRISLSLVDIVICPSFLTLDKIAEIFNQSSLKIGAQDCFWQNKGAYTGEVSPQSVKEYAQYVIVGHSERRQNLGETDQIIQQKVQGALSVGLIPIICVGESEQDHAKGDTEIIFKQVRAALQGIDPANKDKVIFAYEPIWAIGTGKPDYPESANKVIFQLRQLLGGILGKDMTKKVPVLYGGSVNLDNARSFIKQSEISGLLIGTASLKYKELVEIIKDLDKT